MKINWNNIFIERLFLIIAIGLPSLFTACKSAHPYKITSVRGDKVELDSGFDMQPDEVTASILLPFKLKKDSLMNTPIARSAQMLKPFRPESPLSNFASDVLRSESGEYSTTPVDVAIMNMGGLRNNIPEGAVTIGTIYEVFPFENYLCILSMKGESLRKLFEQIAYLGGEGISGARMIITNDGQLKQVKVNGAEIVSDALYTVATLDYLSEGNDKMTAFLEAKEKKCFVDVTVRQLIMNYVSGLEKEGKTIIAVADGRITVE